MLFLFLAITEERAVYFSCYGCDRIKIFYDGQKTSECNCPGLAQKVLIPKNTTLLKVATLFETKDKLKAFVLSSPDGLLSDTSWSCRHGKNVSWSKAVSYGFNDGLHEQWDKVLPNISAKAQWIWGHDQNRTWAFCRKTLTG